MNDFNTVDAFGMVLEAGSILVLEWCRGNIGAERITDSNRALPVMSRFKIVLAALETLQDMLDLRSVVSFFGFE